MSTNLLGNLLSWLILAGYLFVLTGCSEIAFFPTKTSDHLPAVKNKPVQTRQVANAVIKPLNTNQRPLASSSAAPVVSPEELINATRGELIQKLGEAALERREKKVLTMLFIDEYCVLEIFLYGSRGNEHATYYEFRSRTGQSFAIPDCYRRIRAGNAG